MARIPKSTENKATKLSLSLTEKARQQMEKLRDRTDADTLAEVVRRSLALYDFIVQQREDGGKFYVEADGERTLVELL